MALDRRTLLKLTGATAAASTTGLAGCLDTVGLGGDEGTGGNYPSYEGWLTPVDETIEFAFLEWAALEEFDDFEDETDDLVASDAADDDSDDSGDSDLVDEEDPMLQAPAVGAVLVAISVEFGLWGTGLAGIATTNDDTDRQTAVDFETTIDELLLVNNGIVLVGDVDTAEIVEKVTSEPEDEYAMKTSYERTDEYGGYEIYEPVGDEDRFGSSPDNAIAVGDDAIVFSDGTEATAAADDVRTLLAVREGDGDRATDALAEFGWLLETAGDGQMVFGSYGDTEDDSTADPEEAAESEFQNAIGLVSSLSIGNEVTGEFAAVFETIDDETEANLEAELGTSAKDVSIEVDGDRVSASATWNGDILD